MAHYHGVGSGYRVVEYIESTGTQYIDTGFKPNQNSRIDVEVSDWGNTEKSTTLFGTQSATSDRYETVITSGGLYRNYFGGTYVDFDSTLSVDAKTTVSRNGTTISIGDLVLTNKDKVFSCTTSLYLFAHNNANSSAAKESTLKLYSCQIYDNGVMVRDFTPCINPNGVAGLFDKVNQKFYANDGTGTFTAGAATGQILNSSGGVARKVKKRYHEVENVYRSIKKAYHEVDGVARQYFSSGTPVGDLAVGSSVYMNVNGVATEFLVVHQGLPDATMYDVSCDGTWLLMKDLYARRQWDNSNNDYQNSNMHTPALNLTFLGLLDSDIQSVVKQVKIPYWKGMGYNGSAAYGSNGLSTKIFLLSGYETGWIPSYHGTIVDSLPVDGACLDYFVGTSAADPKRISYYNGTATWWWLRSPTTNQSIPVWYVAETGSCSYITCTSSAGGVRPALILPSETLVDENLNVLA